MPLDAAVSSPHHIPLDHVLAAATIYAALIVEFGALTRHILLDGAIGVGLGLYICSHPASAAIDLFYLDRPAF